MDRRRALTIIRRCVAREAFALHEHFVQRMDERGLFLGDVLALVNHPGRVRLDGLDDFGRHRCLLGGTLTDGTAAELLAVIEQAPDHTTFITIYWIDPP